MSLKTLLILILCVSIWGCVHAPPMGFSSTEKSRVTTGNKDPMFTPARKKAQIYLTYLVNETGSSNAFKSNNLNPSLELHVADLLEILFDFSTVHPEPTKYRAITSPQEFKNDYHLKFTIEENNEKSETVLQKIFRGISFGFYPQKVEKKFIYTLEVDEIESKKKLLFSSRVEKQYSVLSGQPLHKMGGSLSQRVI